MHNDEMDEFKKTAVARANKEVNDFVGNNKDLLNNTVELMCIALDAKKADVAGKLAYQITNMAPLYKRSDITNMSDFLCKVLQNADFKNVDAIYELFGDNFKELVSLDDVDEKREQEMLVKTRNALAELRS